jgi:16S rRNA (cytosine1402-N4)-methyltransferase
LATLVKESIPAATRRTGGNPAKRTFQALRIEANDELGAISRALPDCTGSLNYGRRVVVLSFQSLEDRIVKEIFVERSTSKTPRNLPVDLPEFAAKFALVSKSGETPTDEEQHAIRARLQAPYVQLKRWLHKWHLLKLCNSRSKLLA